MKRVQISFPAAVWVVVLGAGPRHALIVGLGRKGRGSHAPAWFPKPTPAGFGEKYQIKIWSWWLLNSSLKLRYRNGVMTSLSGFRLALRVDNVDQHRC